VRRFLALTFSGYIFLGIAYSQPNPSSTNFTALSKRAAEARDADRLAEAAKLYTRALALHPNWEEGWWSLGTLEYDQDRYSNAAIDFQKVISLNPSNGTAHAMLGLCQFQLGKDDLALRNLLAAQRFGIVKDDQLRNVALYHMGVLQLRARRFGDAHETLYQLAKARVKTNELTTALGQMALLIRPQDSPAEGTAKFMTVQRVGEAEALSAIDDFGSAKQIYAELTNQSPNMPNLHFAYGRFLIQAQATDDAFQEFKRELDRDPKNVNSMLEIASVRYQVDSQDGLKYAEEAVKLAPQIPFGHYMLGVLRLDTGDAAGAVPELEIAQKAFPNVANIYYSLGNAYSRIGRKAEAARARAKFVRLNAQKNPQDAQHELESYRERALSEARSASSSPGKSPQ
jgi:tetratricopeptide (TPR) repeat protein